MHHHDTLITDISIDVNDLIIELYHPGVIYINSPTQKQIDIFFPNSSEKKNIFAKPPYWIKLQILENNYLYIIGWLYLKNINGLMNEKRNSKMFIYISYSYTKAVESRNAFINIDILQIPWQKKKILKNISSENKFYIKFQFFFSL